MQKHTGFLYTKENTHRRSLWVQLHRSLRGLLGLSFDDLLAVIVTACLADAVAQLHLAAAGALYDARHGQLPMSATTGISSRLGDFSFRSGHSYTSSMFCTIAFNAEKGFVTSSSSWHVQVPRFRLMPQLEQSPLQSSLQRKR